MIFWTMAVSESVGAPLAVTSSGSPSRETKYFEISFADGFRLRRTSSDPGRALLTGFVFSAGPPAPGAVCAHAPCGLAAQDDWQKLDIAPDFPELRRFLDFWSRNLDGKLHSVKVGQAKLTGRSGFRHVSLPLRLH